MRKAFVPVVILIGIMALAFSIPSALKKAPDFVLKNLEGQEVHSSSFSKKVVLLNFWATWCPPCLDEIPSLQSLYDDYQSKGLEVIGVNLDEGNPEAVNRFVKKNRINFPVLVGDEEITVAFGGIRGIPTTFLIDREGKIVRKYVGEQDKSVFEEAVKQLL